MRTALLVALVAMSTVLADAIATVLPDQAKRTTTGGTKAATTSPILVLPYLPRTGPSANQDFVSFENYGKVAAKIALKFYDDYGTLVVTGAISVPAETTYWVTTRDFERGNASRGLTVSTLTTGARIVHARTPAIDSPARAGRTASPLETRMAPNDWITLAGIVAILGFLWNLHRDVADLRERMARLEGLFEGFTRRESRASE